MIYIKNIIRFKDVIYINNIIIKVKINGLFLKNLINILL